MRSKFVDINHPHRLMLGYWSFGLYKFHKDDLKCSPERVKALYELNNVPNRLYIDNNFLCIDEIGFMMEFDLLEPLLGKIKIQIDICEKRKTERLIKEKELNLLWKRLNK